MRNLRWLTALLLAVAALPVAATAQQTGTVTGRVVTAEGQLPLAGAQVFVAGTNRGARTDQQGRFTIPGVPTGTQVIRASLLGYQEGEQTVSVTAAGTATANFSLAATALQLTGIVVNPVTGQVERRRELGTNVSNIDVGDVQKGPITKLADVLQGRAPGVTLQGVAGTTGTAQRIRIRGANSLSLSNEPLIYIDGVLASRSTGGIGVGGQQPTRLNDINPEDIENIEILKGPAASALYGTAAANGVLLITTRRGRAGQMQWRAYSEFGSLEDVNDYPANYTSVTVLDASKPVYDPETGLLNSPALFGSRGQFGAVNPCLNFQAAAGTCRQDASYSFDQLEDARTTPFSTGHRSKFGLSTSGGSERVTYYLSGDREGERGVIDWNTLERINLRANLNAQLLSNLDAQLNVGYVTSELDLIQGDNNIFSPLINGFLGPAQFVPGMDTDTVGGRAPNRIGSYFGYNARDMREVIANQGIDRFLLGANTNYRPLAWLSVNGNVGLDFFSRHDRQTVQPDLLPLSTSYRLGFRNSVRSNNYQWTANTSARASFDLSDAVVSTTTVGGSFQRQNFQQTSCFGAGIPAGTESCSATTSLFSIGESYTDQRVLGAFLRQEFALNDRVFVSASIRGDQNSGLVDDFITYPSASVSWVVSEEPFFPVMSFLSNLRLRGSYGESGLRPDFGDAETLFSAVAVQQSAGERAAVTLTNTGNPSLKPERTREWEFGGDLGLFDDRLATDFTYFNRRSEDALVQRNLAPSVGLTGSVYQNLGSVRNWGTELGVNALVLDRDVARLNLRVAATVLRNEIEELGEGIAPIPINRGTQAHREGYPTAGFFGRPYTYEDANGDGKIAVSEVRFDPSKYNVLNEQGDTLALRFLGPSLPTNTQSISGDLTLFGNVTVSTLFERRAGHKTVNYSEYFRCVTLAGFPYLGHCAAAGDPNASLEDQARFIAARNYGSLVGYIEDASFTKWRELSVRVGTPQWAVNRFPVLNGASVTLSGRNLATWSDYSGVDPEVNEAGASNFTQGEFNTQPPVRYFTVRLDLAF